MVCAKINFTNIFFTLVEHMSNLSSFSDVSRANLIHHLRSKANHGKMDLSDHSGKILGRLRRVEISKESLQEKRCLNGEVQRLVPDKTEEICGESKI